MNAASSFLQRRHPRAVRRLRPILVTALALALAACASSRGLAPQGTVLEPGAVPVSYTHLTLPTICSV